VTAVASDGPAISSPSPMLSTELAIGGMTCASCVVRVEKKLNRLDGVTASVSLATETARVTFPAAVTVDQLISVVEGAGYTAVRPAPNPHEPASQARPADKTSDTASLRRRLLVSLALAVPVVVLAMVPAAQFHGWQWASLALATPVAVSGAWPFHHAALINARHAAATMDTLISVGVSAAYLWSLYALTLGTAGADAHMNFAWLAATSRPGPSAVPARRCARCSSSEPGTWRCCARPAKRSGFPSDSSWPETGS
jgi:P-type Cu+ transporter